MHRLLVLLLAACLGAAAAQEARPMADDTVLEARVQAIAEELRCLVCQNETIAASHADLAVDLRKQIRQQLQQGRSQAQILDFMVQRYGDFVLYRPPLKTSTWLLWGGPFVLLAVALAALRWNIRRRRDAALPLRDEEAERLRRLLADERSAP
jgi:cytochrome c-type biogenesis protein CcmH